MPTPMIDDLELKAVQQIRQETHQDFVQHRAIGLDGTIHQKIGRRSHRVWLWGYLLPASAADDLKTLQEKASQGTEVTFTADIVTALALDKMVIESFQAEQRIGLTGQTAYAITLAESPPLPPPAVTSSFGGLGGLDVGLDDLGVDLGFDPGALGDVLSDIQDQAGSIMDAVDSALDVVGQLSALASLADLANIASPMRPITDKVGELGNLAGPVQQLGEAAAEIQP
jgi:hypothetical protein